MSGSPGNHPAAVIPRACLLPRDRTAVEESREDPRSPFPIPRSPLLFPVSRSPFPVPRFPAVMTPTHIGTVVLATFLAAPVEFVEALTTVLAVGVRPCWACSRIGAAAGVPLLPVPPPAVGAPAPESG